MDIQILDLIDIVIVAAWLLWAEIVWLQRSQARLAMLGVETVGVVYRVASRVGLQLTTWIPHGSARCGGRARTHTRGVPATDRV